MSVAPYLVVPTYSKLEKKLLTFMYQFAYTSPIFIGPDSWQNYNNFFQRDIHWDMGIPDELPYTVASLPFRNRNPPAQTSTESLQVPFNEQQPIYPQYFKKLDKKKFIFK